MTDTLTPDQQLTLARALWPEREFLLSASGEPLECQPPNYWDGLSTFAALPPLTSPEAIGRMVTLLAPHMTRSEPRPLTGLERARRMNIRVDFMAAVTGSDWARLARLVLAVLEEQESTNE